jgi:hypothetical protein
MEAFHLVKPYFAIEALRRARDIQSYGSGTKGGDNKKRHE